jgi:Cu(I)/Ag(I) efflux system membrane protein CusA/SilA
MPALDEGDLLYMPTALPGLSAAKAAELLQQTDRLIRTVPEVASVFGKAGRADSATDPAPLEMFETTIQLKPREEWRAGHDPGQTGGRTGPHGAGPRPGNIWVPPIRNRIDMLATGIKSPIGVKVAGAGPGRHRPSGPGRLKRWQGRARRQFGAGRAADRRPLYRGGYPTAARRHATA